MKTLTSLALAILCVTSKPVAAGPKTSEASINVHGQPGACSMVPIAGTDSFIAVAIIAATDTTQKSDVGSSDFG
jgi:hypothetical protein